MRKKPISKEILEELIKREFSIDETAKELATSTASVARYSRKYDLKFHGYKSRKHYDTRSVVWSWYKSRGNKMVFNLSELNFYELIQRPCVYCGSQCENVVPVNYGGKKGSKYKTPFYYTGLDRVDSNKGYTYDNVAPCCQSCNGAKSNLGIDKFLNWLRQIRSFTIKLEIAC